MRPDRKLQKEEIGNRKMSYFKILRKVPKNKCASDKQLVLLGRYLTRDILRQM